MKAKVKATGKIVDGIPIYYGSEGKGYLDVPVDHDIFDRYDIEEVELLEQPPLSEGLDEAAWDCVLDSVDVNNPVLLPKYKELLTYLFKAGAEWMAQQGWISVDEKLPEMDEEVIVLRDKQNTGLVYEISFGHLVDTERCIDYNGWNVPNVKFWMPMPKIPEENI